MAASWNDKHESNAQGRPPLVEMRVGEMVMPTLGVADAITHIWHASHPLNY